VACVSKGLLKAVYTDFEGSRVNVNFFRIFTEFKEALTEQYVLQQLIATQGNPVFYWATEKGTAEVDFVVQRKQAVIPIEVKAEENLKAKSLKVYVEQFQPEQAIRFSMVDYREQDWLVNVPLYGVSLFDGL
jgi:putative ATPase